MMETINTTPFFGWEINNKIHNTTNGFWGDIDTTHSFCEPHYTQSWYIAEFYNSISSLVFCILSRYLFHKFPKDRMVQAANIWLLFLGIGSTLFHGTMKYAMQLMDEGPMVGWLTTIILAQLSCGRPWLTGKVAILQAIVVLAALGLVLTYAMFDQYEIFIHGYGILVLVSFGMGYLIIPDQRSKVAKLQHKAMLVCFVAIIVGKICWELENRLCDTYPLVWPLHAVWHFLACVSVYAAMVNAYLCRMDPNNSIPDWIGFRQERVKYA